MAKEQVKQMIDKVAAAEPVQALTGFSVLFQAVADTVVAAELGYQHIAIAIRNTLSQVQNIPVENITDEDVLKTLCELMKELPSIDLFDIIQLHSTTWLGRLSLKNKQERWKTSSSILVEQMAKQFKPYGVSK